MNCGLISTGKKSHGEDGWMAQLICYCLLLNIFSFLKGCLSHFCWSAETLHWACMSISTCDLWTGVSWHWNRTRSVISHRPLMRSCSSRDARWHIRLFSGQRPNLNIQCTEKSKTVWQSEGAFTQLSLERSKEKEHNQLVDGLIKCFSGHRPLKLASFTNP